MPQEEASLKIQLFGACRVWVKGVEVNPPSDTKAFRLLALLVLRHPGPAERSWLIAQLWPDAETPERGQASLRATLGNLKKALGAAAARLKGPRKNILQLDLDGAVVDVLQFDEAIRQGNEGKVKSETELAKAVDLHRFPLLEQWVDDEWTIPERETRKERFLEALESLAQGARARMEYARAVHFLGRAVATDPLRESAQRALMEASYRSGDPARGRAVYRELCVLLHRELEATPDGETTVLFRQLQEETRERSRRSLRHPRITKPLQEDATNLLLPGSSFVAVVRKGIGKGIRQQTAAT